MAGVFLYSWMFFTVYYNIVEMENHRHKKLIDLLIKIGTYVFIVYILFLLGRVLWTNFNLKESISKLHQQIAVLEQQKKDLNNLILYYQSDSFKELEARRKLGFKKPGEKVVILELSPSAENFPEEVEKEKKGVAGKSTASVKPNWRLWWEFFMK